MRIMDMLIQSSFGFKSFSPFALRSFVGAAFMHLSKAPFQLIMVAEFFIALRP